MCGDPEGTPSVISESIRLTASELNELRATIAFLETRMAEQSTLEWALDTKPGTPSRLAIKRLLDRLTSIPEPWISAGRIVEEGWTSELPTVANAVAAYDIQARLRAGDKSGSLVNAIVELVRPRLKVTKIGPWRWRYVRKPRHPKKVEDLISIGLASGEQLDVHLLELDRISSISFLLELANGLDSAVNRGLDVGRRVGWIGGHDFWKLGDLARVYYVKAPPAHSEPDSFHEGIAPSVKLLHAVLSRLSEIDEGAVVPFLENWKRRSSPVHLRLWAAIARQNTLVERDSLATFFAHLNDDEFWRIDAFPELSELRARRFSELSAAAQATLERRILKGPPRRFWSRSISAEEVRTARLSWTMRELQRIKAGGGILAAKTSSWIVSHLHQFSELHEVSIDFGFPSASVGGLVPAQPDRRYDVLTGAGRLQALEQALTTARRSWDDDPAEGANDWIHENDNAVLLVADFEEVGLDAGKYSSVWDCFGRVHRPPQDRTEVQDADPVAGRVLILIGRLPDHVITKALDGLGRWLSSWKKHVVDNDALFPLWDRLWAAADQSMTSSRIEAVTSDRPYAALNIPAAHLIDVFLAFCEARRNRSDFFGSTTTERRMADFMLNTQGPAGLVARYRLTEQMGFFLARAPEWTSRQIVEPLKGDNGTNSALWQAVGRSHRLKAIQEYIGTEMAQRSSDATLPREVRRVLLQSLVFEVLLALSEDRSPVVSAVLVSRSLRAADDEARSAAAAQIKSFVAGPSGSEERLKKAAAPFLRTIWPQERSLTTPGISRALASLPASSGSAFAEAVDAIAPFLMEFDCWSMASYGLYGTMEGQQRLSGVIRTEVEARALLAMLSMTVGEGDTATVPHDLADALELIATVAPALVRDPRFRRLSTSARP